MTYFIHALILSGMNTLIQANSHYLKEIMQSTLCFAEASVSENTKSSYAMSWRLYVDWSNTHGFDCTADKKKETLLAMYISSMANKGLKLASILLYFAGIVWSYKQKQIHIDPTNDVLKKVLAGVKRTLGSRQERKSPIVIETLRSMTRCLDDNIIGTRDKAILLLGFAGAFRRSELCALNIEDLSETKEGYLVLVRKSKTDQEKKGMVKSIPYGSSLNTCPVRAIKDWLECLGRTEGPLFVRMEKGDKLTSDRLRMHWISNIIKRNHAIIDESTFASHSLRAGFVTTAARNEVPIHSIMTQTGHQSVDSLMIYIREAEAFKGCAASRLGL